MFGSSRTFMAALALLTVVGCAKSYVVTRPVDHPLETPVVIGIGEITDDLPADVPQEKKPTDTDLSKLRRYLEEEIAKRKLWTLAVGPGDSLNYEIRASLLEYKRGSGALRFLVGFGAGNARTTMALKLVDKKSGAVAFSGNFKGVVTDWATTGDQMFRKIAADFAKALEKQLKSVAGKS